LKTFIYVSAIIEARACHHQVDHEGHPQGQGHEHRLRRLDQRRKDIVAVSWIVRTDGPKRINLPELFARTFKLSFNNRIL
jgi:hypothetical protein